jgi:hypothetical protein
MKDNENILTEAPKDNTDQTPVLCEAAPSPPEPGVEAINSYNATEAQYRFAADVHLYTVTQVQFAETKAALILGACSFLFAMPITQTETLGKLLQRWHSPAQNGLIVLGGLSLLLYLLLLFTVYYCVRCLFPNLSSSGGSKIYFGDIAGPQTVTKDQRQERLESYVGGIQHLVSSDMVREMAAHTFDLSTIVLRKYHFLQRAVIGLSVILFLCLIIGLNCIFIAAKLPVSP